VQATRQGWPYYIRCQYGSQSHLSGPAYSRATPCGWPARVGCSLAGGLPVWAAPLRVACPCGLLPCGWPARVGCSLMGGLLPCGLLPCVWAAPLRVGCSLVGGPPLAGGLPVWAAPLWVAAPACGLLQGDLDECCQPHGRMGSAFPGDPGRTGTGRCPYRLSPCGWQHSSGSSLQPEQAQQGGQAAFALLDGGVGGGDKLTPGV
jgi:hypothetical protein